MINSIKNKIMEKRKREFKHIPFQSGEGPQIVIQNVDV